MEGLRGLRDRFVDGPSSVGERRRSKRWEVLRQTFPDIGSMAVIDLGGRASAWERAPIRPASVHIVNLEPSPPDLPDWMRADQEDACALPARIASRDYDLVFSNSVIEHVGGHAQRQRFAEQVHALAPRYWVQTPYRYFPLEPHWLFPGLQFLPITLRAAIALRWPLSKFPVASREDSLRGVMEVELLSRAEMMAYFPGSSLLSERMLGLAKSIIAVQDGATAAANGSKPVVAAADRWVALPSSRGDYEFDVCPRVAEERTDLGA